MRLNAVCLVFLAVGLSACGTRSSGSISPVDGAPKIDQQVSNKQKDPSTIPVYQTDVTDKKYHSLGDISVTVSKNTIFDADPTPALIDQALQKKAATVGADAVILARYGTVGISLFSYGSLDGNGRAIAYDQ